MWSLVNFVIETSAELGELFKFSIMNIFQTVVNYVGLHAAINVHYM